MADVVGGTYGDKPATEICVVLATKRELVGLGAINSIDC